MREPYELIQFYEVFASTIPQPPRTECSTDEEEPSDEPAAEEGGAIACSSKQADAAAVLQSNSRKQRMAVREGRKPAPKKRSRAKLQEPADLPEPVRPLPNELCLPYIPCSPDRSVHSQYLEDIRASQSCDGMQETASHPSDAIASTNVSIRQNDTVEAPGASKSGRVSRPRRTTAGNKKKMNKRYAL